MPKEKSRVNYVELNAQEKIEEIYAQVKNRFPITISQLNNQIVKITYEDIWFEDNIQKQLTPTQIKKIEAWMDAQLK